MEISLRTISELSAVLILIIVIIFPLSMLIYGSFGGGSSFKGYNEILTGKSFRTSLMNTLLIAGAVTAFATAVGVALSWITSRTNTPFRKTFDLLFTLPFLLDPLILTMSWIILSRPMGLLNFFSQLLIGSSLILPDIYSFLGIVWVMALNFTPLMYMYASTALKNIDPAMEEASALTGAGTARTALRVTLPLAAPGLLSGALLVFVGALSMFSVPILLGRPNGIYVLTTQIYDLYTSFPPNYSLAAAISVILILFASLGLYLHSKILGRREFTTISGKGFRSHFIELGRWKYVTFMICVLSTIILLVLPVFSIVFASFLRNIYLTNIEITVANYADLFKYPRILTAIQNSLFLSILGATLGVLFTAIISTIVVRGKGKLPRVLDQFSMIPAAIPATSLAVAMLWAWVRVPLPIYGTIWILLIAYLTHYLPHGVRTSSSSLRQINKELEEASSLCGASWSRTISRVTLPLLKPALLTGWSILFMYFMRETTLSLFLYTYGNETLPLVMFDRWTEGSFNLTASLAVLQMVIIFAVLIIVRRLARTDSLSIQ